MKKLLITILLTASALACPYKFEAQDICVDLEWTNGPFDGAPSNFNAQFTNLDGDILDIEAQDLEVYSWMIMARHEHGGPAIEWSIEDSVLAGTAKFFMGRMKGQWQVRLKLNDEVVAIPVILK